MDATVDGQGRIEIPQALRERLGMGPGSRVSVEAQGERLVVESISEARLTWEEDGLPLIHVGLLEGFDFEGMVEADRRARAGEVLAWKLP